MSLFSNTPESGEEQPPSTSELAARLPPAKTQISLSAEQMAILDTPVEVRVDKLLRKLYGDRAAAEKALEAGGEAGKRHVVQDTSGFWRIADGPGPEAPVSLGEGE